MFQRLERTLPYLFRLGVFAGLLAMLAFGTASRAAPVQAASNASAVPTNNLLQFKAAGHVLGFRSNQVYLAAPDHALSVEFVGSDGALPQADGQAAENGGGHAALPLGSVTYSNVWDGVTVMYAAVGDGIAKSTYLVAPGADAAQIQLRYNVPVEIQSDGSLEFQLASTRGALSESAPAAWQEIGGERVPVNVAFALSSEDQVRFQIGTYDTRYPLTIDPTYQWHAFYGSGSYDNGNAVAVDGSGNVYIAGYSPLSFLGDADANPKHAYSGSNDIFVVKLDSNGVYQWHTFYGSNGDDYAYAIGVDGTGNVYVAGGSWGTWVSSPKHAYTDTEDIVVFKLDPSGALLWNTFYGSTGADEARGIFVESGGNVFVTGYSYYSWQGDSNTNPRHALSTGFDLVVLKLNTSGVYQWHTFWGGTGGDMGYGIAQDATGSLYVTGFSTSASWPGAGVLKHSPSGGADIFVLKLNSAGDYTWHTFYGAATTDDGDAIAVVGGNVYVIGSSDASWQGDASASPKHAHSGSRDMITLSLTLNGAYQWHTFYGSTGDDYASGMVADSSGNVYVAESSSANWQGDANASAKHAYTGGRAVTVVKLNSSGVYQWHTFYGSSGDDWASAIARDSADNVYVAGTAALNWQGDGNASPKHFHSGWNDMVGFKLNSSGAYQWHTFYGSASDDRGNGLAVDSSGNVYVTGSVDASWGDFTAQYPLHQYSGTYDIFVLKLNSSGAFQWNTFYGSSSFESGNAIAVDGNGNVYVVGSSGATWQGDGGADPKHPYSGSGDIFVLKLNKDGAYQWHTFYGSASPDTGAGIALDGSGNLYIAGHSNATWQGDGAANPKHPFNAAYDLTMLKLDSSGTYQWHTFYGSSGNDYATGIAVDASNNLYVTGGSPASWQGDASANPKHPFSSGIDIFVVKLNSSGVYQWHTFYGSSNGDYGDAIAVDGAGAAYVAGYSLASWQGDGGANPKNAYSGGNDVVVLKLDSTGAYQWHTFYGSSGSSDIGWGIAARGSGDVYVTGYSTASWQGVGGANPKHAYTGSDDILLLKLDANGAYQWHTFYGSAAEDSGKGVALGSGGAVYVTGVSYANWQADGGANPLHSFTDAGDAYVIKLTDISSTSLYLPLVVR